jgi:flagellar basal-body rod protein FlgC
MDVISGNIANINTTRSADGGPYKRREVVLTAAPASTGFASLREQAATPTGVRVAGVVEESGVRLVNDPGHPDADANGNVAYPDIDLVQEMTDMMSAVRAYEASVTALNALKGMAMKALDLAKA